MKCFQALLSMVNLRPYSEGDTEMAARETERLRQVARVAEVHRESAKVG